MLQLVSRRDFLKIQVTPDVRQRFEALYTEKGMTQIAAATRVFDWFMAQDETVQAAVLGLVPKNVAPDVARLILERMACLPSNATWLESGRPAPAAAGPKPPRAPSAAPPASPRDRSR